MTHSYSILHVTYLQSLDKPADAWFLEGPPKGVGAEVVAGAVLVFAPLDAAKACSRLSPRSYGASMAIPLIHIESYNLEPTSDRPRSHHDLTAQYAIPGEGETLYIGDTVRYKPYAAEDRSRMIIIGYGQGYLQVETSNGLRTTVLRPDVELVP